VGAGLVRLPTATLEPGVEAKAEAPKVEALKVEAPKAEATKVEAMFILPEIEETSDDVVSSLS
jgi:hypothetical protein